MKVNQLPKNYGTAAGSRSDGGCRTRNYVRHKTTGLDLKKDFVLPNT
jgi:hypothetical protein